MKKLFCTLALIAVICFSADAEISKTYCPKFETSSNLFLLFSNKGCSHLPEYSSKVSINMSANFGIGSIEGTCEGGGTSANSAQEACDKAYEVLSVCARMAARMGFDRVCPPPVDPLSGGGSW